MTLQPARQVMERQTSMVYNTTPNGGRRKNFSMKL